ncbi:MAG: hypothetical protein KA175_12540 [Flavobacteriales bacterium]|nr:hypothetical protein [Flavobacteriales bacterium]MBP6698442.1 hypothetical protein [Flavobacteriales bacterium]
MFNASYIRSLVGTFLLLCGPCAHGQALKLTGPLQCPSALVSRIEAPLKDDGAAIDVGHMPSPYSYQHLGIFCKAEVKLNRWLPVPVMIRLGDVQRAEELDGKGLFRPSN